MPATTRAICFFLYKSEMCGGYRLLATLEEWTKAECRRFVFCLLWIVNLTMQKVLPCL
eukprot:SAG11_NODE_1101_length_5868_cov_2.045935_1_plen_58_part_00